MGEQIASLATHFKVAEPYASYWPTYVESLNYPASTDVLGSVHAGAISLVQELNWAAECAVAPNIILAGHSQGAMVIEQALGNNPYVGTLTLKARTAIKAAVMYGNPGYRSDHPYIANSPAPGGQGLYPDDPGMVQYIADNYQYYGWDAGDTNPSPSWHYKVREYCIGGDAVCQNNLTDSGWQIHNSYPIYNDRVIQWFDSRLASTD